MWLGLSLRCLCMRACVRACVRAGVRACVQPQYNRQRSGIAFRAETHISAVRLGFACQHAAQICHCFICVLTGTVQCIVQLGNPAGKLSSRNQNSREVTYKHMMPALKKARQIYQTHLCAPCTAMAMTDKMRLQLGDHQVCIRHSILRLVDPQTV